MSEYVAASMTADAFRSDNAWRPPVAGSYVYLEVRGDKARLHFRLAASSDQATDWLALDSARARAVEIAKLEGLSLPLTEQDAPQLQASS